MNRNVQDALSASTEYARIEKRRTRFLIWAVVIGLLMNVGWLAAGVVRDKQRTNTIEDLTSAIRDSQQDNLKLQNQVQTLSQTIQNISNTQQILDEIRSSLSESRRSLDCVALFFLKARPPTCRDIQQRLNDLLEGEIPNFIPEFPSTTTTTTPVPSSSSRPSSPQPPPPVGTTTIPAPTTANVQPCSIRVPILNTCLITLGG